MIIQTRENDKLSLQSFKTLECGYENGSNGIRIRSDRKIYRKKFYFVNRTVIRILSVQRILLLLIITNIY